MKKNNIEKFNNGLYKVYTTTDGQEITFKAVRLRDINDNEEVRIYLEYNGKLIKGLQVPLSKLNENMKKIIDHGAMISYVERANLLKEIYRLYKEMPVIDKVSGLGWQYDSDKNVTAFAGSEFIGVDGNPKVSDIEADLPIASGEVDMGKLNTYMNKNVVREIAMLHNLTAPVAGLLGQCFVLSLCGKSSTGKTTLAKLAISQTCSTDYDRLCKTLNTTDNASEKGLMGIRGLGVLLDDTSLTNKGFDWNRFIYRLSTGKSKDRLGKEYKVETGERFYSTITLTTEKLILSKVDPNLEGNNGRIIEIPVKEGVVFDDDVECRSMERYYTKNYGITLSLLVKKIMELGIDKVLEMVYDEEERLRTDNPKAETVVKRHFLEIAAMRVTAGLANQYLGYQFHMDNIRDFLIHNITESLHDTRAMQSENVVMGKIYPELIKAAMENESKTVDGETYYPVRNEKLKELVDQYAAGMTYAQAKQTLWENGKMYKKGSDYSNLFPVDGEYKRFLLVKGAQ